jgi:hypothetical protein
MSFNPYQTKYSTLPEQQQLPPESIMSHSVKPNNAYEDDGNNATSMSGGDAFQAFLSKNDGGEDEEDE